jgi:tetratricopeptide (TPR) repeat protein
MEDLNSNQPVNSFVGEPENTLAGALEDLLAKTSPRSEIRLADAGTCPEPGEWLRMASGEAPTAEADELLTHAAACPTCVTRLRMSLLALAEDVSPEETAELSQLASASPQWQHRFAVQLAQTPHKAARNWAPRLLLWAGAGLAASLVVTTGIVMWWQNQNSPERLLAEAYTHSRIFDLRMPGAGYAEVAPVSHLRGDATGREPAKLLEARSRIERQLERTPGDPHWLQLEARADLLEEKYDPAIDILDRLVAAGPVTPGLLVDDASAYFQRGTATESQNDRATALDDLRRADELAPDDPVVLFNEALVMEDRGQVMNAVETWNRYLRFERDAHWLAEGRRRLKALEEKLNRLKSHQSRMEQHLATPQAMRALAADPATLAAVDEELSSGLLPRLLDSAFPLPMDRSRGSPCDENCQAARTLFHALAASLERNHQDPWLTQLLPPDSSPPSEDFVQAAHALGQAIDTDALGDYTAGRQWAIKSRLLFHTLRNAAGEDRAEVERVYALQRLSQLARCYQAAHALLARDPQFAWIHAHDLNENGVCDTGPGAAAEDRPSFTLSERIAQEHHYVLLDMRTRNMMGGAAVESGDTEDAWRIYLDTIHRYYSGDFPAFRAYTILAGLAEVEKSTPRVHLALLLQREVMGILEQTQSRDLIPSQRFDLAIAAIRAGFIPEAQEELRKVQGELARSDGAKPIQGFLADSEIAMANLYLTREDLTSAASTLDAARVHMAGQDDFLEQRAYAAARGQLELALGHPETAESMLREAILKEERQARRVGTENIIFAQQNRDLYAVLAGVWLAQGRSGQDVLALWERYRLRVLGKSVPTPTDRCGGGCERREWFRERGPGRKPRLRRARCPYRNRCGGRCRSGAGPDTTGRLPLAVGAVRCGRSVTRSWRRAGSRRSLRRSPRGPAHPRRGRSAGPVGRAPCRRLSRRRGSGGPSQAGRTAS